MRIRIEYAMAALIGIGMPALLVNRYLTMEDGATARALATAERMMDAAKAYEVKDGLPACGSGKLREVTWTGKPDEGSLAVRMVAERDGCERPVVVTYRRYSSRRGWHLEDLDVTGG